MPKTLDIASWKPWPSKALSNFAPHPFVIDGVRAASMEAFLQALKYKDLEAQDYILGLDAAEAKSAGRSRNLVWTKYQTLWWRGRAYPRQGVEYQALIRRAYQAMWTQNTDFRTALEATSGLILTHKIGERDPYVTILTEAELCLTLMQLRDGGGASTL